jgi:hypothetical protein
MPKLSPRGIETRRSATKRLLLVAAVFAISPASVTAASIDPRIVRWFHAGDCPAFNGYVFRTYSKDPPWVKNENEGLDWGRGLAEEQPVYVYDPVRHFAVFRPRMDVDGSVTVRLVGPPPPGVPRESRIVRTTSGVTLGSTAATVVRLIGKPLIVKACGVERYAYQRTRFAEPTSLEFTIRGGRVVEIFENFGG